MLFSQITLSQDMTIITDASALRTCHTKTASVASLVITALLAGCESRQLDKRPPSNGAINAGSNDYDKEATSQQQSVVTLLLLLFSQNPLAYN